MLTDLQKEKLTHYFNLLDFDNSGTVEKDDYLSIAENLCVLWRFEKTSDKYKETIDAFSKSWDIFRELVDYEVMEKANLEEWLSFADNHLVNGPEEVFDKYMKNLTKDIFENFDLNKDGFISLDEYIDLFMAYRIEIRYSAKSYTKLDLNSDDLLSLEELLSAVNEFFRSDDREAPGNWLFGFWGARN